MVTAVLREADAGTEWGLGPEVAGLRERESALLARLRRGEEKIAAARGRDERVDQWEDLWIGLLREYEQVYDHIAALAG